MSTTPVRADNELLQRAARALNIAPGLSPQDTLNHVLREAARPGRAVSRGGTAPNRAGRQFANEVIEYVHERGLTSWERLAGRPYEGKDILDTLGSLPDGFLVGFKSRQSAAGEKLWSAMDQCDRAMTNLDELKIPTEGVIPFQVVKRSVVGARGLGVERSYAVTELRWFADLVLERRKYKAG